MRRQARRILFSMLPTIALFVAAAEAGATPSEPRAVYVFGNGAPAGPGARGWSFGDSVLLRRVDLTAMKLTPGEEARVLSTLARGAWARGRFESEIVGGKAVTILRVQAIDETEPPYTPGNVYRPGQPLPVPAFYVRRNEACPSWEDCPPWRMAWGGWYRAPDVSGLGLSPSAELELLRQLADGRFWAVGEPIPAADGSRAQDFRIDAVLRSRSLDTVAYQSPGFAGARHARTQAATSAPVSSPAGAGQRR